MLQRIMYRLFDKWLNGRTSRQCCQSSNPIAIRLQSDAYISIQSGLWLDGIRLHRIIIDSYRTSYGYLWYSKWRYSEILPLCLFFYLFFCPFSCYPIVAIASIILFSSSLTPVDSVSIVSRSASSSTDVEIKLLDGKTFVRVYLERSKRLRRG